MRCWLAGCGTCCRGDSLLWLLAAGHLFGRCWGATGPDFNPHSSMRQTPLVAPPPAAGACRAEAQRRQRRQQADELFSANVKARKAAQLPDPDDDTPPKGGLPVLVCWLAGLGWAGGAG